MERLCENGGTDSMQPTAAAEEGQQLPLSIELPSDAPARKGEPRQLRGRPLRALRACAAALLLVCAGIAAGVGISHAAFSRGPRADDHVPRALTKLAFGSCAKAELPQPFWGPIVASKPDVFVFAGDIVYGDCLEPDQSCAPLDEAWAALGRHPDYAVARAAQLPILGMLDDHDNGRNDASGASPFRAYAKRTFLDFFAVPADDVWRGRQGLYRSQMYAGRAPDGAARSTQLLLLDVRSFRAPEWRPAQTLSPGHERYEEDWSVAGLGASMLGDAQWAWLEAQLRAPAHLRVLVSTIQVLPQGHGWERWGLFPHELARLLAALRGAAPAPSGGRSGVLLLSGDRHLGGLYEHTPAPAPPPAAQYNATPAGPAASPARLPPLYELTSSSLTHSHVCSAEAPCSDEAGPMLGNRSLVHENNWGELVVDWRGRAARLALRYASAPRAGSGRRIGETLLEHQISFDELGMS